MYMKMPYMDNTTRCGTSDSMGLANAVGRTG